MNDFEFEIKKILSRKVKIKAKTEDEAYKKIKKMYREEEIVLNDLVYIETVIANKKNIETKEALFREVIEYLYKDEKKHFQECNNPSNHVFLKLKKLKELI